MSKPQSVKEYLNTVTGEREEPFHQLRETVLANLGDGFEETMSYGMIGYVVPHSLYPSGYHCSPELPLPFANLANQKSHIGFYNMGLYADPDIYAWFVEEYGKRSKYKLNMGKSCVRFKRMNDIPYDLIGELMQKFTVENYIALYENQIKTK